MLKNLDPFLSPGYQLLACGALIILLLALMAALKIHDIWARCGRPKRSSILRSTLSIAALMATPRSARGAYYRRLALSPARLSAALAKSSARSLAWTSPFILFCYAFFLLLSAALCLAPFFSSGSELVAIPFSTAYQGAAPAEFTDLYMNMSQSDSAPAVYQKNILCAHPSASWKRSATAARAEGATHFAVEREAFENATLNAKILLSLRVMPPGSGASARVKLVERDAQGNDRAPDAAFDPSSFLRQAQLARPFEWSMLASLRALLNPRSPSFLNLDAASESGFPGGAPHRAGPASQARLIYARLTLGAAVETAREALILWALAALVILVSAALLLPLFNAFGALPSALQKELESPERLARWEAAVLQDAQPSTDRRFSSSKRRL